MKKIIHRIKTSIMLLCFVFTMTFVAATKAAPPNQVDDFTGFFIGWGAGHTSLTTGPTTTVLAGLAFDSNTFSANNLAPLVQLGYWGHIYRNWLWGG